MTEGEEPTGVLRSCPERATNRQALFDIRKPMEHRKFLPMRTSSLRLDVIAMHRCGEAGRNKVSVVTSLAQMF